MVHKQRPKGLKYESHKEEFYRTLNMPKEFDLVNVKKVSPGEFKIILRRKR